MTSLPEPVLSHLGAGDRWRLVLPCEIPMGEGVTLTVPEGFVFDLASTDPVCLIPGLGWLFDDDSLSTIAPLAHDVCYRYRGEIPPEWLAPYPRLFSRREADRLLYDLAVRQGCPRWRARLAYWAVRAFAGGSWRKR